MIAAALGHVVGPGGAWRAFTLDPLVVAGLLGTSVLYARGRTRLPVGGRSGPGRRRAVAFALGEVFVAVALVSPIDAISDDLFSVHMVQHLLLIVVAAPLLVLGRPGRTILAGLPGELRGAVTNRRVAIVPMTGAVRLLRLPAVAWTSFTLSLWGWHLPVAYDAAIRVPWLHAMEHVTFLGTSMLVWSVGLERRRRTGLGVLGRALFLLATAVQSGVLGALLLFASRPLYSVHGAGPAAWGLTPLQDQQLAGALMWIPPSAVYLTVAATTLVRWFRWMGTADPTQRVPLTRVEGVVR